MEQRACAVERKTQTQDRQRRALESIRDPTARLVAAIRLLCDRQSSVFRPRNQEDAEVLEGVLTALFPRWDRFLDDERPPWDGRVVARWFAEQAKARGIQPSSSVIFRVADDGLRARMSLSVKQRWPDLPPEPVWRFIEGSTVKVHGVGTQFRYRTAYVLPDGRLLDGGFDDCDAAVLHAFSEPAGLNLGIGGLMQMADLLGIDVQESFESASR